MNNEQIAIQNARLGMLSASIYGGKTEGDPSCLTRLSTDIMYNYTLTHS